MAFPTYINFQVNNTGGGRSNMVVHSHAVILMLLSLCPEKFRDFLFVTNMREYEYEGIYQNVFRKLLTNMVTHQIRNSICVESTKKICIGWEYKSPRVWGKPLVDGRSNVPLVP